jgi:hypothetical protein
MKLLFCRHCEDIYRLFPTEEFQFCKCGNTGGRYVDNKRAEYFTKEKNMVVPLGFDNYTFLFAINHQRLEGRGNNFNSFVIPKICDTFIEIDYPEK